MELSIAAVERYCRESFLALGVPEDQAQTLAAVLIEADLRGHVDHGSALVAYYKGDVRAGAINVRPAVRLLDETAVSVLVDGDGGFGAVAASRAMAACVERARAIGIGVAAVRNSSHCFYPGYYALLAAEAGFVGFFTTTSKPALAPAGAARRLLGQNPICYGIPAGRHPPILLDAGLGASIAKIRMAMHEGRAIPPGWALDRNGNPTTDARAAMEGLLLPIGEHKGYGLALAMDALVSLGGAPSATAAGEHGAVGHFMFALDPGRFGASEAYRARVDDLLDQLTTAETFPGRPPLAYPGESGSRRKAAALARGTVDLPDAVVRGIEETARELGIAMPARIG
jgi:LDH2 family malate/lactate/ureidoglycolate dehydrogenase